MSHPASAVEAVFVNRPSFQSHMIRPTHVYNAKSHVVDIWVICLPMVQGNLHVLEIEAVIRSHEDIERTLSKWKHVGQSLQLDSAPCLPKTNKQTNKNKTRRWLCYQHEANATEFENEVLSAAPGLLKRGQPETIQTNRRDLHDVHISMQNSRKNIMNILDTSSIELTASHVQKKERIKHS